MARPGRLELPTLCLEGRRSIQLSYGRILGYSFDSTKVATPIRQPIAPKSWRFCSTWSNLEHLESNFLGWNRKSNADILSFREATFQLKLHARVELGHRLGLVSHPEIVNVFLTSLSS